MSTSRSAPGTFNGWGPEFKDSKQTVFIDDYLKSRMLQVKTDFYPRYSDHFMVTIKVRIMDDDD